MALLQNRQLTVLQLGYNMLGDVGATILAPAIQQLETLDLGFNSIGDVGCAAIATTPSRLRTLYLAGNKIGQEGALALADQIPQNHNQLCSLYLTGNDIGADGVEAISSAIVESEAQRDASTIQELYLGAGMVGCQAVAPLLQSSSRIKILSLPNCEIKDDSLILLCRSMEMNSDGLPLESLQLSFNRITCNGVEHLVNALVAKGACPLRELLLDNNDIGDRGVRHLSAGLIPHARVLETLDIGFNRIETTGIKVLTKTLREHGVVKNLSVSGNAIDTIPAAKSISFFLACSPLVESIALVRCFDSVDAKRHIAAGVVSNPGTVLKHFSGFPLAQIVTTLGFPPVMDKWTNTQILDFIHIMWKNHLVPGGEFSTEVFEEEKIDPIHCLSTSQPRTAPIEATVVIEAAKKTFSSLAANGLELFTRQSLKTMEDSPLASDSRMIECCGTSDPDSAQEEFPHPRPCLLSNKVASFVAPPETTEPSEEDQFVRRRWLEEWVNENSKILEQFAEQPFNASELWRLHQHFFSAVVNVSGGENPSVCSVSASSLQDQSPGSSEQLNVAGSQPTMTAVAQPAQQTQGSSLPMLKRKVSYSCLSAVVSSPPARPAVSLEIPTMPPKTKRARRNRTRISFLPRIQAKLNSYLDVSHEKSLVLMRRLHFCEQTWGVTHLSGRVANDAETILLELM